MGPCERIVQHPSYQLSQHKLKAIRDPFALDCRDAMLLDTPRSALPAPLSKLNQLLRGGHRLIVGARAGRSAPRGFHRTLLAPAGMSRGVLAESSLFIITYFGV